MVATTRTAQHLTHEQLEQFENDGHLVIERMYGMEAVALLNETFAEMHRNGPVEGYFNPLPESEANGDPLKMYPRIMHPHRFNDVARRYLLDPRLEPVLTDLFGEEPLATQSMLYFKPPTGRGQALHQDNFYLNVEPGTCIAAWLALDVVDRENGGLEVVPGTYKMDLFCPEEADASVSFTREYVPPPPGPETGHGRYAAGRHAVLQRHAGARFRTEHDHGPVPPFLRLPLHRAVRGAVVGVVSTHSHLCGRRGRDRHKRRWWPVWDRSRRPTLICIQGVNRDTGKDTRTS